MEKKRLQFDFTQDALQELDELQRVTGAPTRAELIRHSLRLLQWMIEETKRKEGTLLIERNGKVRELVLLPYVNPNIRVREEQPSEKSELLARD
jgi:metal-responsive CopG/Arc/MetJ family transcriptional regulator